MNKDKMISGQIFLRDARGNTKDMDGSDRKLMMVVGIIAVPKDTNFKSEHKYTVAGDSDTFGGKPGLVIHPDSEDLTKLAEGMAAGSMLTQPIWRI